MGCLGHDKDRHPVLKRITPFAFLLVLAVCISCLLPIGAFGADIICEPSVAGVGEASGVRASADPTTKVGIKGTDATLFGSVLAS